MIEPVQFAARDGYALAGMLYRPAAPNGRAVLVNAAVGVKQSYYSPFAAYLAERGFAALSYDYRGIGASRRGPLRALKASMSDWARLDAAGALDFLERATPGARLAAIGHSFGGQAIGIIPGNERIAALLTVGSQSGYWGHWRGARRVGMWLFTYLAIPGLTPLFGYCPASRLGIGEDLPAAAGLEWARWCRHPEYLVGALGAHDAYARFRGPLRACWIEDDSYAPLRAVQAFVAQYRGAQGEIWRIAPREVGARAIGHFGFFRERFRDTLWRDAADWLAAQ